MGRRDFFHKPCGTPTFLLFWEFRVLLQPSTRWTCLSIGKINSCTLKKNSVHLPDSWGSGKCSAFRSALLRETTLSNAVKRCRGTGARCCSNTDRKSTRLNSSHANISYAVFCLKTHTNRLENSTSV